MTLYKLKSASFILIEDDNRINMLPLLLEIMCSEKNMLNMFCVEQPVSFWKRIFKNNCNINYHEEYSAELFAKCTEIKSNVVIDSINQLALCLGWNESLKILKNLCNHPNIAQLLLVLHKDSLLPSSKLHLHLSHIANAIISYDAISTNKIYVKLKKGGKIVKSEEILSYDSKTNTLKSTPVVKNADKIDEPEKPLPSSLTTFKIEADQTEKLEKFKLKLPYMSKINEGESKVYYEPDAVDDWDEEDPDEDLDI